MQKILFLISLLSMWVLVELQAASVDLTTAKLVAQHVSNHQLAKKGLVFSADQYKLVLTEKSSRSVPLYYVFNIDKNQGFIIVAADDAAQPILGYSFEAAFNPEKVNITFAKWMESYRQAMLFIIDNKIKANEQITRLWSAYRSNNIPIEKTAKAVDPLCKTKWDQSPFVNDACPYDEAEQTNCVTGCPATAMAQIMKFWNHPVQGTGFHSYQHPNYGALSANFGNTRYDWTQMPDVVDEPNEAVALLMYHAGVACEMQYTAYESGAYILIDSPNPTANSEYAYKKYFGYSRNIRGLYRGDYEDEEWIELLKAELDAGRPMQYAGFGGGGHTFVCDGYDEDDMFHMNWGWGGAENGFFLINSLNPGAGGIGSGEGTYNEDQQAIIGIRPQPGTLGSAPKFGITLGSKIELSQEQIYSNDPFSVDVDLHYSGSSDYLTDVAALLFNEEGVFIDYVGYIDSVNFKNGTTTSFSFATEGIVFIPGKHSIGIYSSVPSDTVWHLIKQASFINPIQVNLSTEPNDLKLNAELAFSAAQIRPDEPFSVAANLINSGEGEFKGSIVADVFDIYGEYLLTIEEISEVSIAAGDSLTELVFESEGLSLEPGSYYIALFESQDDSSYHLLSNDFYNNPLLFNIVEPELFPDEYEQNNSAANAYQIPLSFIQDTAYFKTEEANIHIGPDIDHYSINLAPGFRYSITARVHDEYDFDDGEEYSNDVYFTYDLGQGQSDHIDAFLPLPISVPNGGLVNFKVSPFFVGLTGSYALELEITRTLSTATKDLGDATALELFPVPASQFISLNYAANDVKIDQVSIINLMGQVVRVTNGKALGAAGKRIEIAGLAPGMYTLLAESAGKTIAKKFIVGR